MGRKVFFLSSVLSLAGVLSCGSGQSSSNSTPPVNTGQILYAINGGAVTTYVVDANSLSATPVEQPVDLVPTPATLLQFDPSPDDHYVYAVWSDGQSLQHLSVFQTDSFGVPQVPAMQVLNADSLSQFNMHPSGRFAYMLEVTSVNNLYKASIRLFTVQASGGTLEESPKVQGSYAAAPVWPVFLYGFSTNGNELYDTSFLANGSSVYRQRSINTSSGFLGSDTELLEVNAEQQVSIGQVIVDQYQSDTSTGESYLNVYSNVRSPSKISIHCTMNMLGYCATASAVQLAPGGHYLFLTDPATQAIHIVAINLSGHKIADTHHSIPMAAQTPGIAFSPDGTIVYDLVAGDHNLHIYQFDKNSGSVSESSVPIPLGPETGICPALYR